MRPYHVFHALEELRTSSSAPLRRKGVGLSADDSETVRDVYQQWLALACDLGYLPPEELSRTGRRLWFDLNRVDVLELNNYFAECLRLVQTQNNKGFKALCSRISSHLWNLIRSDVSTMREGNVSAAKRLIQLFSFTSRLSLRDIDLSQQCLESYLECESSIPETYPEDLIRRMNKVVRRWIGSFVPEELSPRHGPGGVAGHGRCAIEVKYKDLTTDQRLEYAFGSPWWTVGPILSSSDRMSQTIFVPKSYKTFRTISMEPATLQYFQQGVWGAIDSLVGRNRYLREHIGFHEQGRNQRLAREGSIRGDFATLDLSSASDLVGWQLVKKVFRGTWLSRYLVATRSTKTLLPDGRIIDLRKFAPMGSALCFPIETLIFASVLEVVTRDHHLSGLYSAFGDDLIVPAQCADDAMSKLESLGFRVNRDKSFYLRSHWYRESCGGEYIGGIDVSPMRISRKYAHVEQSERLTSLIDLANNAYTRGFKNLRYFYLARLREAKFVPLFSPTSLQSDNYSNYHTKKRWNKDLQRIEVKVNTLKAKPEKTKVPADESIRYRHWLETTHGRQCVYEAFESVTCRTLVKIQSTWVSKPYEELDQPFIDQHLGRD